MSVIKFPQTDYIGIQRKEHFGLDSDSVRNTVKFSVAVHVIINYPQIAGFFFRGHYQIFIGKNHFGFLRVYYISQKTEMQRENPVN